MQRRLSLGKPIPRMIPLFYSYRWSLFHWHYDSGKYPVYQWSNPKLYKQVYKHHVVSVKTNYITTEKTHKNKN